MQNVGAVMLQCPDEITRQYPSGWCLTSRKLSSFYCLEPPPEHSSRWWNFERCSDYYPAQHAGCPMPFCNIVVMSVVKTEWAVMTQFHSSTKLPKIWCMHCRPVPCNWRCRVVMMMQLGAWSQFQDCCWHCFECFPISFGLIQHTLDVFFCFFFFCCCRFSQVPFRKPKSSLKYFHLSTSLV